MKNIEVALVVIKTDQGYWLQRRSQERQVGAAGKLGCFGGRIVKDETPEETAIRELAEETGLVPNDGELINQGVVRVVSDMNNESVNVIAHHYLLVRDEVDVKHNDPDGSHAELIGNQEIGNKIPEMTPATKAIFLGMIGD